MELNEGMRRKALEKTARLENVEIREGNVTDLRGIFPDSHFDGVLINQVWSNNLLSKLSSMEICFIPMHTSCTGSPPS